MSASGRVARRALRRWSWRLYRREWRQQVLVLALITVAVAASVLGATAAYNVTDTRVAEFGSANHRFENAVSCPEDIAPYTAEAEEWFGTVEVIGHRQVRIPGTTAAVELRSIEPDGAFSGSMVSVLEGRRPASVGEIALTEGALSDLDAGLGDQVEVDRARYEVVGVVENPADLDDEYALVLPAGQTPESITLLVDAEREHADRFRPSVVPGQGFIESREVTEQTTAAVVVFVVATVAMVLVCLVAGASFATLAHRRMRQLGLLAAAGATPRHLRRAMVANGTAVGLTAAFAGTAAGLLAWLASASALEPAAAHRIDRWNIPVWLPVAGIGLAVATATMAAWWPARAVARMPITDAIVARPPAPRRVHRSLAAAIALLAYGVLAIGAGIDPNSEAITPIFFISGMVALPVAVLLASAPVLRAVARLARRFPVGTRLAVRDLARFESCSAAALGAITLSLGIAVSVVVIAAANVPDADEGNLQADQLVVWTYSPNAFGGLQVPELSKRGPDPAGGRRREDRRPRPRRQNRAARRRRRPRRTRRWPAGSGSSTTRCWAGPSTRTPSATPASCSSPRPSSSTTYASTPTTSRPTRSCSPARPATSTSPATSPNRSSSATRCPRTRSYVSTYPTSPQGPAP